MNKLIKFSKLLDIYPKAWSIKLDMNKTDVVQYRNIQHFKNHVKQITQREGRKCGVSYSKALKDLLTNKPLINKGDYEVVKNKVKENLMKRGLISDTIYESYKYEVEGDIIDISRLIADDPNCCLVPNNKYESFFYELYINVSYSCSHEDSEIRDGISKILATVELLEQEHIYIKIVLLDTSGNVNMSNNHNLLTIIPLFSFRDYKSIEMMSAVINERLLRKFLFAQLEDIYGSNLACGYGTVIKLPQAINLYNVNEIDLASNIIEQTINKGKR